MPKRIGYILTPETLTVDLCLRAILNAGKSKRYRWYVKHVNKDLWYYAVTLRYILLTGLYRHGGYRGKTIENDSSGKKRELKIPQFWPDKCVHHVILLLFADELVKRFDHYCASAIKKRGTHYARKVVERWIINDRKGTKYFGMGDVVKCYDNIHPGVVLKELERIIKDKYFLGLLREVLYSYPSLPLGNVTSGWFQNVVLTYLDRVMREQDGVKYYVRYSDNFVFAGPNKRKLHRAMRVADEVLKSLGMRLNRDWQVFPLSKRGLDFVGHRFFPKYVLLRKRNLKALLRSYREYCKNPTPAHAKSLLSRMGQMKWFCSKKLKKKYFKHLDMKLLKGRAKNGESKTGQRT